jgi:hypothetical protein
VLRRPSGPGCCRLSRPTPQKPVVGVEEFGRPRSPCRWSLPRGICLRTNPLRSVTPDRLAIDTRQPVDLPLANVAIK